jgi:hypothetical protein
MYRAIDLFGSAHEKTSVTESPPRQLTLCCSATT